MFGSTLDTERVFGQDECVNRTRVRGTRMLVAAVVGAALLAGPVARALAPAATAPVARRVYIVKPGDSLWSIAVRVADGRDPRIVVDAIGDRNHVEGAAIVPGQTLIIPSIA
jgi:nucleoid-associated protein YgaU